MSARVVRPQTLQWPRRARAEFDCPASALGGVTGDALDPGPHYSCPRNPGAELPSRPSPVASSAKGVFGWSRTTSTGCPRSPALLPSQAITPRPRQDPTAVSAACGQQPRHSTPCGDLERLGGVLRAPLSATRHSDRRTCTRRVRYTATVYRWPSGREGDSENQNVRRWPRAPARWSRRGARPQQLHKMRSPIARRACGSTLTAGRRSRTSRPRSAGQWLTISVSW